MAFHDSSGFRAGTSIPFQWYDLKKEKAENLKIYPHVTMDATLRHYEKLNSQEAIDKVISLKEEVKSVEGRFSFIWHNSSFADMYGWAEWKEVLEEVMI